MHAEEQPARAINAYANYVCLLSLQMGRTKNKLELEFELMQTLMAQ
jgi:hypothetical protein